MHITQLINRATARNNFTHQPGNQTFLIPHIGGMDEQDAAVAVKRKLNADGSEACLNRVMEPFIGDECHSGGGELQKVNAYFCVGEGPEHLQP